MTNNKKPMPAFPISSEYLGDWSGMTLRDYFAAKAMQALIHTRATLPEDCAEGFQTINYVGWGTKVEGCVYTHAESIVHDAYFIAGEMLKERERE
jgi:hypothetical protein